MRIAYNNRKLEKTVTGIKAAASAIVIATFVLLFGFDRPLVPRSILYGIQILMLIVFLAGKVIRFVNATVKREYLVANWFEFPLLIALGATIIGAAAWFGDADPGRVRHTAVGIYLVIE